MICHDEEGWPEALFKQRQSKKTKTRSAKTIAWAPYN